MICIYNVFGRVTWCGLRSLVLASLIVFWWRAVALYVCGG